MAGMDVEVIGRVTYKVHLTENDVELVKEWIDKKEN